MPLSTSRPRSRRWLAWGALLLALALVGLAALALGGFTTRPNPPASAEIGRGDIEIAVTALGKIGPKTFVDVGAQVSGQLDVVHVAVGDRVEAGQLLAEIDPRIYESRVEANRARVESLQAQVAERSASLQLARSQHARNQALAERGLIARDLLDTSAAGVKQAQAQGNSVQAQLKEAQSTLAGDSASLDFARIYAPIAGTVVSQAVLAGQTLNTNQVAPTLLRIADLDTMTVTAQVAEADIGRVKVGMPAYFTTLGQPQRRWTGTVRQLLPTPDILNDVVLYRVLIDVDNGDGALLPDMTAQVFFQVESALDVVVAPANAVFIAPDRGDRPGRAFVRVLQDGKRPERREVEVGLRARDRVEIVAGLSPGERVLLPDTETAPAGRETQRRGGLGGLGGGRRR